MLSRQWKIIITSLVIGVIIFLVWFLFLKNNTNGGSGGGSDIKCGGCTNGNITGSVTGKFKNVLVLDPSMSDAQDQINKITVAHGAWCTDPNKYQFAENRALILLKPGVYNVTLYVGYYISVAGLGKSPSDVVVDKLMVYDGSHGGAQCNPPAIGSFGGLSTENFWRSVENLTISNDSLWSVSQAAPLRRIHCKGSINFQQSGWASGGFTADTIFDKVADRAGNQQWFFRNSSIGIPAGCGNWNTVFLGCEGQVADTCNNDHQCISISDADLTTIQKPTLFLDENDGNYKILRPNSKKGAGPITLDDYTSGDVIENIYIANDEDTAESINSQISNGKHIVLSPGIYKLTDSIVVDKANTVILGFGMPTIVSNGKPCIVVKDVDCVTIAGVLLDCGPNHTSTLLQWGTKKEDHPGFAHDIYTRVGGAAQYPTSCDSMVEINSNGVIGDNFWLWRADHGYGMNASQSDFTYNVATNGLVVNGDNVTMYGLAVEHCQKDLVVWNGENGSTYWYQSEVPYDMPNGWNYYAYHVSDNVQKHTGIGLGAYSFLYQQSPPIILSNAFKTPSSSNMSKMLVFNANSPGGFQNIWNDQGGSAIGNNTQKHICK